MRNRALATCLLLGCGSRAASVSPPRPAPPPADHRIHSAQTREGDGIRLRVEGQGVAIESLPVPDWVVLPVHGTVNIHVDLLMPHTATPDFRVATGEASLTCIACVIGGGPPPAGLEDDSGMIALPPTRFERLEARAVLAAGVADITTWTAQSSDVDSSVHAHAVLAQTLGDSAATVCIRFRSRESPIRRESLAGDFLTTAGIEIDAAGFLNVRLSGALGDLLFDRSGCNGTPRPSEPDTDVGPEPPDPGPPKDGDDLARGITVIDVTHRTVTRALVMRALSEPTGVRPGARIVPATRNGEPSGYKLYAIRPSSRLAAFGFTNGDTVTAINGVELTSIEQLLDALSQARSATAIRFDVTRRGQPVSLVLTITD